MKTGGLLVALLLPAVAMAQAPSENVEEAQRILNEGVQLMDQGHLPEARQKFQQVQQLAPDKANPYRLLGVVDFRLGQCKQAIEELETFLRMVGPNDRRVTEVVSMRDKCKEDLAPKLGELVVQSTPPGADVFLDDDTAAHAMGSTPYRNAQVQAGPHVVFVRKKGFKPASRGVTVVKDQSVTVTLPLIKEEPVVKRTPLYKKHWFWGVFAGAVAVAGGAVALGVYYGTRTTPFVTTLPPINTTAAIGFRFGRQ